MKIRRLYCPTCETETKCTSQGANHLLHAFLSIFTIGFWVLVWVGLTSAANKKWNCDECGAAVSIAPFKRARRRAAWRTAFQIAGSGIGFYLLIGAVSSTDDDGEAIAELIQARIARCQSQLEGGSIENCLNSRSALEDVETRVLIIEAIERKLKAIPSKDTQENIRWYKELVDIDPDTARYHDKLQHYQAQLTAASSNFGVSAEPQEEPQILVVEMSAELVWNDKGGLSIRGTTNLPDGTELGPYVGNDRVGGAVDLFTTVSQGAFYIDADFWNPNSLTIEPGLYHLSIVTVMPQLQPESVRQVIGEHGEYLSGGLVDEILKVVMYERTVKVGPIPQ